jgi:hypothetical protein
MAARHPDSRGALVGHCRRSDRAHSDHTDFHGDHPLFRIRTHRLLRLLEKTGRWRGLSGSAS